MSDFLRKNSKEANQIKVNGSRKAIGRCQNCVFYNLELERCTCSVCKYKPKGTCQDCPYVNGICNICYRQTIKNWKKEETE